MIQENDSRRITFAKSDSSRFLIRFILFYRAFSTIYISAVIKDVIQTSRDFEAISYFFSSLRYYRLVLIL